MNSEPLDQNLKILERLEENFKNLKFIQKIYQKLGGIVENNKKLHRKSSFYDYLKFTFCVTAGSTVRKIIKETRGSDSIQKLIKEIIKSSNKPNPTENLEKDFKRLNEIAESVIAYTDKHWAHLDPTPPEKLVLIGDIYKSIDEIEKLLKKIIEEIRGESRAHFDVELDDWEYLFTFPWIDTNALR
jgi:CRISPR/Cas system CSM-associated protein Csm2 small subunit